MHVIPAQARIHRGDRLNLEDGPGCAGMTDSMGAGFRKMNDWPFASLNPPHAHGGVVSLLRSPARNRAG